ncbi:murein biosynthesis integral membrane protein MurJ [Macellibacteroides fermentans]|uniref:murein biosynthesis integral membrane protein MurJ n=1 Tax=Macellibacteroides fermentans TaxID=879969 RepID=UPI00406CF591
MVSLTLVSKFLGFLREMVMANYYGTSYIVDAYVMATAIPGIIFGGIFGAIATAYTPSFSSINEREGKSKSNMFTSQVINLLVIVSLIVILIGIVLSKQITNIFASGFNGETADLTSYFIRITFSYILFSSLTGILDAHMQYKGYYLKPIISGYFQNISIIAVIIVSAYTSHYYLAFGALIGGFLKLTYIIFNVRNTGFNYSFNFSLSEPIRKIFFMALPVFLGSYIIQINSFVDKALASSLPEGSVAALNYGMILITLITGLTVTLLVTFVYPRITKAYTLNNLNEFNLIVEKTTNLIAIITIPFSMGILAFSNEVVQIVYERGEFDSLATKLTASAFFFYGIGLVFFSFNDLLAKVFYSMRNTFAPIVCSGITVIINIILNLILVGPMAHRGLAFATAIASIFNSLFLYVWVRSKYPEVKIIGSFKKILKIFGASFISVSIAFYVNKVLSLTIWMPRFFYLSIAVIIAAVIYIFILKLLRVEEVKMLKTLFQKQ